MTGRHTQEPDARVRDLISSRRKGWSLEQPFYTDPEIFALDQARIHARHWLYVGHSSEIPNPGEYFTYQIANESLVLIRGRDRDIQALYNVCRHRGSRICTEPTGHVNSLVCPYHQWAYDLEGRLINARLMPEDLDKSEFGLHRAHVRVVGGLIFISLAQNPPDFDPVERDIRPHLEPHGLERARICHRRRYDVQSNWKLIAENFRECYHCGVGHPEYCRAVIGAAATNSPALKAESAAVRAERKTHWQNLGLETRDVPFYPHTFHHVTRYPFRPGFVSESLDGQPVAPLMGSFTDQDAGIMAIVIYPNFWFEASGDHAVTMRHTPISPTSTEVEMCWLVREDAVEGVDYDPDRVAAFWRITGEQDWKLCADNQAGVNSNRYQPGPYGLIEGECEAFVQWYLDRLAADESVTQSTR